MATDTQETIADIIAEMCDLAKHRDWHNHTSQSNRERVSYCADRLEAALKRESGDPAKLREALKKCLLYIACAESVGIGTITLNDKVKLDPKKIIKSAKDALAEPSRNCDRFGGDIDKLREACARERGLNPEEDFPDVFPDWLLAPTTEKEGGAK